MFLQKIFVYLTFRKAYFS